MNQKITPRDFFLHLGATIALYASAVALINLAFSVINYFQPDPLASYFYAGNIATPISMLVILVPILYLLESIIARDIRQNPDKKGIWIRRWRIYLTLFLTIALIGGDLVALINVYLSGEITSRFVYKVLAILLVAGTIGKHYYFSIADDMPRAAAARKLTAGAGAVLVLAAIVGGFAIVGSPMKQRDIRFDNRRVSDLSSLQWQAINYWQRTERLPADLDALADPLSNYRIPLDPETRQPYEYSVTGPNSFQICATFALPSQDLEGRGDFYGRGGAIIRDSIFPIPDGQDSWKHEAGRTCFDRTIDPELYPPYPKERIRG